LTDIDINILCNKTIIAFLSVNIMQLMTYEDLGSNDIYRHMHTHKQKVVFKEVEGEINH
jgi:hypothetical protein